MRKFQRGQALLETVIALPVTLLALFMLFWTAKFAILSERLESDTRYAQQILSSQNLYTEYSLVSLYDASSGSPQLKIVCATPPPELISSTQTVTNNAIAFPRQMIWAGKNVAPSCSTDHQALLADGLFSHDILIGFQRSGISASFTAPFTAQSLFPAGSQELTLNSQSIASYQSASVSDIALCYPALISAVSASLARGDQKTTANAPNDGEFAVNAATLNEVPPTNPLVLDPNCVGRPPQDAGPATGTPVPAVSDNVTPQPTPSGPNSGGSGSGGTSGPNGSPSASPVQPSPAGSPEASTTPPAGNGTPSVTNLPTPVASTGSGGGNGGGGNGGPGGNGGKTGHGGQTPGPGSGPSSAPAPSAPPTAAPQPTPPPATPVPAPPAPTVAPPTEAPATPAPVQTAQPTQAPATQAPATAAPTVAPTTQPTPVYSPPGSTFG